ncbi:MAG: N,N-dimethylformamidase beta subunit family domain-containing protein, partial [Pseudomonadales bacterium]
MLKLLGYADRYSVVPGEAIAFQVSAEDNQRYQASLVRVICGDCNPEGPGLRFETIASGIDGSYSGARQTTDSGSYMEAVLPQLDQAEQFSFCAMVWPTLIEREQQAILSRWNAETGEGFRLLLSAGVLALEVCAAGDTSRISLAQTPMLERQWYRVGFSIDFDRLEMTLLQSPLKRYARIGDSGDQQGPIHAVADHLGQPLLLAGQPGAEGRVDQHFDGKIDSPVLFSGIHGVDRYLEFLSAGSNHPAADDGAQDDLLAYWDFSDAINTQRITDRSVNANHGRLVNMPARAMKGWNWDGEFHRWSDHPNHYGAIHFHHDDLYDANWETAFRLRIPPAMKSGAYAVRIYCGDNTVDATRDYYVPFFVRAPRRPKGARSGRDKIAFLAPTASYMAYANHSEHIVAREAERTIGRLLEFGHA